MRRRSMSEAIEESVEEEKHYAAESYSLHSLSSSLLIRQLPSQGISFQLWPAAAALVRLLDAGQPPALFAPRRRPLRLLELGSGTGLVGIAAAALLGASVTVTDLPHVLPNLRFNVDANAGVVQRRGGAIDVAALSWGDARQMEDVGRDYDVVLGSDVVYHDNLYEPLMQTLRYFLLGDEKEREVLFLMAHLKRWKKESCFFKKAKKAFHVETIHSEPPSNGSRVGVHVYSFVRRSSSCANQLLNISSSSC